MLRALIHLVIVSLLWSATSVGATGAPLYSDLIEASSDILDKEAGGDRLLDEGCELCHAFQHVTVASARSASASALCALVSFPGDAVARSLSRSPDGLPPEFMIA